MPKTREPQVGYKTITPEVAQVLLRRSRRKNVPVKQRKIDQYARDMLNQKWDPNNSQAVSIDTNDDIVNGHQRLLACVQAGVPFTTLFVTGVPPESFRSEDTGRSRDAGHFFAILGEKNYTYLAAGARALYAWERGIWRMAATTSGGGNIYISNEELEGELGRRPQLREAAAFAKKNENPLRGRFKSGMVVALHALSQEHPAHAEFWKELVDRLSVYKKSPAWQLNRRIDQAKARGANLSPLTLLALLTKVWNSYASDEWKVLMWDADKEPLPSPVTKLTPALLPPKPTVDNAPKLDGKRPAAPAPSVNGKPHKVKGKKGLKLRGGLNHAAA